MLLSGIYPKNRQHSYCREQGLRPGQGLQIIKVCPVLSGQEFEEIFSPGNLAKCTC